MDGPGIAGLLAQPMPGTIRTTLLEAPEQCVPSDHFQRRHAAIIIRDAKQRIIGHGARTVRRLRLNRHACWVGYLHGLRRTGDLTGEGRRLAASLRQLCSARRGDESDHDFTAILSDNFRARRVLEGGLPGAPEYHALTDYNTLVIDGAIARQWQRGSVAVRPLPEEAKVAAQALYEDQVGEYSPVASVSANWHSAWRGDRLLGVVLNCDRRQERREMVVGYAPWLYWIRPLANLGLTCLQRPRLPPAGTILDVVYASHLSVADGDVEVIRALIGAVAASSRARLLVVGFGRDHVLAKPSGTIPAWRIASRLYAVGAKPTAPAGVISPEAAWL
jgi:hypothetical protein